MEIYNGGSENADLVKNMTGLHKQTKVSIPGNQVFVKFEANPIVTRKGFNASIHIIGINNIIIHLNHNTEHCRL